MTHSRQPAKSGNAQKRFGFDSGLGASFFKSTNVTQNQNGVKTRHARLRKTRHAIKQKTFAVAAKVFDAANGNLRRWRLEKAGFQMNKVYTQAQNGQSAQNGAQPQHSDANGAPTNGYPDAPTPAATSGALDPKHRAQLETDSGLCADAIEARGYFTQTDRQALKLLGFAPKQCLPPALVIPLWNWRGEVAGYALRPDIARNDANGRAVKYEIPLGASPVLDVAPLTASQVADPTKPLLITEGAKKADCAASVGLCAVNLNGVYGFRGKNAQGGVTALPDWENIALKARAVYVAFDSDASTKPQVEGALNRLCAFLVSRGALVKVVYFPTGPNGEKTGLDDFFARGGTLADLYSLARDLEPLDVSKRKRREAEKADTRAKIEEEANAAGAVLIETNSRQQQDELEDLARAIEQYNARTPRLFHGAAGLMRIEHTPNGAPALKFASREAVQSIAGKAAKWIRTSEREGTASVSPPRDLCAIYLASPEDWRGVPPIEGTATAPFFAPNGTLCDATGYHAAARVWLQLPANFQLCDTTPTPENLAAARRLILDEILGEVSFGDDASRAHAVAQMLLPFVRRLIPDATPLHLWNAPLRGSGKSYAAELCILPFVEPTPTPEKKSDEEWRKSLFCDLITGPSHIFLDNIKGSLQSPTLDLAITAGFIKERLTGTGDMVTAPIRCVWVATANNAELTEDIVTRAVVINIDPESENPDTREFKSNPKAFIRQNRGQVCGALLTLVRAWQAAGSPNYCGPNRCRFPDWQNVIGGILDVAEIPGFLDNLEEARENISSGENDGFAGFVELWAETHGEKAVTVKDLLSLAEKCESLTGALSGDNEGKRAQQLAKVIRKRRNRVFSGLKIVSAPKIQRQTAYKLAPKTPKTAKNEGFVPENIEKVQGLQGLQGVSINARNPANLGLFIEKSHNRPKFAGFRAYTETPCRPCEPCTFEDFSPENGADVTEADEAAGVDI